VKGEEEGGKRSEKRKMGRGVPSQNGIHECKSYTIGTLPPPAASRERAAYRRLQTIHTMHTTHRQIHTMYTTHTIHTMYTTHTTQCT